MEKFSIIVQVILAAVWMTAVPFFAGGIFGEKTMRLLRLERRPARAAFRWCGGQMALWAGFELISVPMIIKERLFHELVWYFLIFSVLLAALGVGVQCFAGRKGYLRPVIAKEERQAEEKWMWIAFGAIFLVQIVCAFLLAYEEGDDAFYVAVSTITNDADTMYRKLPYTGGVTGLNARHGLSPMPIWISFLARITRLPAVSVAQVAVPVALIIMAYAVFYLVAGALFPKSGLRRALFMMLVSLMVLFGGYSVYSMENFMIVRTAQGKAVLGSIVLPFLLFLMMALLRALLENEKIQWQFWLLVLTTVMAGCLCSIQGALLIGIFLGVTGACAAVCCRRWKFLLPLWACCIPAICCLLLYTRLD